MLKKDNRLKKRYQFAYVYRAGSHVSGKHVVLYFTPSKTKNIKVGFAVTKKLGKAYLRNFIRRRLREIIYAQIPTLKQNFNLIVVAKQGCDTCNFGELEKENETLKTVKLTIKGDGEIIPEEEKTEIKESLQESIETNPNIENKTEEIKELPPLEVKPPKILMEEGTVKEEFIETRDVYGTTCEYLVTTYYTTYTDGTKREMGTTESLIDCTYSTYNATLEDLAYEAGTQMVTYADYIGNVIILLNQKRVENGLKEFVLDVELSVAAELRSLEVGYSNNFSYTRPNTTQNMLDELAISYQDSGEYILKDISEPTIVASSVLQNENMNKLIYDDFYTRIGVGLALVHDHYYWTIYVVA